jgi:hypothetical protein
MNDAPRPGLANTVPHATDHPTLRCVCAACCEARAAEVRRRLEEQRRERSRDAAAERELVPVLFQLRGLRRAMPGTQQAIAKRYGRGGR